MKPKMNPRTYNSGMTNNNNSSTDPLVITKQNPLPKPEANVQGKVSGKTDPKKKQAKRKKR